MGEEMEVASVPREERPGPGPSPMDMIEAAVAGCTGIDVVMILQKMRKNLHRLEVEVVPTRREAQPRVFTHMELVYHMDGDDINERAAVRAVKLSQDKYCSVSAMLRGEVEFSYRIVLNGSELGAKI